MRGCLALLLLATLGCKTTRVPANRETRAEIPGAKYVTVLRLANELDLDYRGDRSGLIELTAPPDNVMLVPESRRALVNGETVSMRRPCMLRGEDYVLSSEDAATLSRRLNGLRAARQEPDPLPLVVVAPPPPVPLVTLPDGWRPRPDVRIRDWKYIVIHHMASPKGSAAIIHRMHRERGWEGLGYHFVIGNGSVTADGLIEVGYRWRDQDVGAHARARPRDDNRWNLHGIGICLIGDFMKDEPTRRQLDALVQLVRALRAEYGISASNVVPHRFVRATECPGRRFPWDEFLARIR